MPAAGIRGFHAAIRPDHHIDFYYPRNSQVTSQFRIGRSRVTEKFSGAGRILSRANCGENQDGKEKRHAATLAKEGFHRR